MDGWLPYTPKPEQDGFRILFLEIQNHPVLARKGNRCQIQFFNKQGDDAISISKKPYSTVIIGANGIGKSFILSALAEIFRQLKREQEESEAKGKSYLKFKFAVKYYINGHSYDISTIHTYQERRKNLETYFCLEDGKSVGLNHCPLPSVVLASSITINDRFKTQKEYDGYYWYLGARNENSPSTTGTKTIVRKTVSAIAECLTHDEYFRNNSLNLLEKLGLEPKMEIEYAIRYKEVYFENINNEAEFVNIYDNWENVFQTAGSKRKTAPWGIKKFAAIRKNPENVTLMVSYLNMIRNSNRINNQGHLIYNIQDSSFKNEWAAIQLLSQLDILSYPKIRVYKKVNADENCNDFLFEDSSTGETSLLCQFINILSKIQHHSLILIDEPESSTHPNWQIRYVDWLNDIFSRFNTCHFILTTHSHFLLSELEEDNSAIVALSRNNETGGIENKTAELNTFGWSTDDILYEVFNIRNRRNEALARDLERAMLLIDNGEPVSEEEKDRLLKRFNNVYQGERDPLGAIIKEFENYAESRFK